MTRTASNASFLHSPWEWAVEGAGGSRRRGVEDMRIGAACRGDACGSAVLRLLPALPLLHLHAARLF